MARDIEKRITQLRNRRSGTDRLVRLNDQERRSVLAKSLTEEAWQKRASNKPYTRYALGAMQEVGPDYTRISLETAGRVGQQLEKELTAAGYAIGFELQGSVPLNVHIRGVSDVDLLSVDLGFLTYATTGYRSQSGLYTSPTTKTSLGVLSALRSEAERILKLKFPATIVDTSGGKAINISGGSLARPVDVVPSHWHDTEAYQASGLKYDRAITILNKKVPETIDNLPFLHIKRITDQDVGTVGGLKKAIRLCKNVKSDAEEEGTNVSLPSFDIAATMYYANRDALMNGCVYELAILAETQRYLDFLACNHEYAKTLTVPDGSRKIFDTNSKLHGLNQLSIEMDDLTRDVAREQNLLLAKSLSPSLSESRAALASSYVL